MLDVWPIGAALGKAGAKAGQGTVRPIPLLPAQMLWINMLTHGLPGVALGAEPADPRTMRRLPRPPQEFVLGGGR